MTISPDTLPLISRKTVPSMDTGVDLLKPDIQIQVIARRNAIYMAILSGVNGEKRTIQVSVEALRDHSSRQEMDAFERLEDNTSLSRNGKDAIYISGSKLFNRARIELDNVSFLRQMEDNHIPMAEEIKKILKTQKRMREVALMIAGGIIWEQKRGVPRIPSVSTLSKLVRIELS